MSVESVKTRVWIWLLLSLLTGVLVGLSMNKITAKVRPEVRPTFIPGRIMNITIDQSQQDDLFGQLQEFAEKWRYAVRIQPTDLNGVYRVDMWRSDIHVGGGV